MELALTFIVHCTKANYILPGKYLLFFYFLVSECNGDTFLEQKKKKITEQFTDFSI